MNGHRHVRFAACFLGVAALSAQTQQPVFRAGASLVTVDVYPTKDGRIVEGLTKADFEVFEDGRLQSVDSFEFVRVEPAPPEVTRRDPNTVREMYAEMADPHTRLFVTFLDHLHTSLTGSHNIRRPLLDMLGRVIGPNDLFGVMRPRMRPQEITFGRGMLSTERYLTEHWDWGERQNLPSGPTDPEESNLTDCFHTIFPPGDLPADWIIDDGAIRRFLDEILIERYREDVTLGALEQLVGFLAGRREARTVVVAITDGWVLFQPDRGLENQPSRDLRSQPGNNGPIPTPFSRQRVGLAGTTWSECVGTLIRLAQLDNARRLRELVGAANRANVSFYPVTATGLQTSDGKGLAERLTPSSKAKPGDSLVRDQNRLSDRVSGLRTLAEGTDGIAIVQTNDIVGGLKRIENDVSAYYLLGYYSTNTKQDGKLRRIEVKVKPAGLDVRARRWYRALAETTASSGSAGAGRVGGPPVAGPAVDDALSKLANLRSSADAFVYGVASPKDVAVVVELASRQLDRPPWANGADVDVELKNAAGEGVGTAKGKIEPGARGVLVRVATGAAAGPWTALAHLTSGGASIDERLQIPAPAGLLVGSPIVFRATPSPRSPLRPVAEMQFRRTERVHIEWPILKALDQRTARVLDRRGQPLALPVTVTERDVDGVTVVAIDLNLGALAEGDYVIELVAGSAAETERKLVAIHVVA